MDEKSAFSHVINVLTDHNLRQSRDYVIESYNKGCFLIRFCPKRFYLLDIQYFYEMIPDIVIFKIKRSHDVFYLNIKIRLR